MVDVVKFVVSTGAFVAQEPYPRKSKWGSKWLDPGSLVKNCPSDIAGYGWAPIKHIAPSMYAWEEHIPGAVSSGSLVNGVWEVLGTKQKRTKDSVYTDKKQEVSDKIREEFAKGFSYNGKVFGMSPVDQSNMTSCYALLVAGVTDAHGGYWRAEDNTNVAMNTAEAKAFLEAAWAYGAKIIRNAHTHKDALAALKNNGVKTAKQVYEYATTTGWGV